MAFNLEKLKEVAKPRNEISKKRAEFRKENRALLRTLQDLIKFAIHPLPKGRGLLAK